MNVELTFKFTLDDGTDVEAFADAVFDHLCDVDAPLPFYDSCDGWDPADTATLRLLQEGS